MVKILTKDDLKVGFLGSERTSSKKTIEDEEPLKVTLLLTKDTLDIIDRMVKNAKVGSRGRLIQLLIDDIWSLQEEYKFLNDSISAASQKKFDQTQIFLHLTLGISGILRRLGRYYDQYVINKVDKIEKT